jgi:hypothetical protein
MLAVACLYIAAAALNPRQEVCTGSSTNLTASECKAWQLFYDGLDWSAQMQGCAGNRNTPCDCGVNATGFRRTSSHHCPFEQSPCVECRAGHITKINLDEQGLGGSIAISIGDLSKLSCLALSSNNIHGTIPSELAQLSKLSTFWLAENNLSGLIPHLPFGQFSTSCDCDMKGNTFACPVPNSARLKCGATCTNITT